MDKEYSTLTMRTWHIDDVLMGDRTYISNGVLMLSKHSDVLNKDFNYVKSIDVRVIYPCERNVYINTIMDIFPIATKVSGRTGTGVTHVLTGVCVMLTGCDENGIQMAEFGSSEGILSDNIINSRPGTPSADDIIIHIDITLSGGAGASRQAVTEAHQAGDMLLTEARGALKKLRPDTCSEKHVYTDKMYEGRKNIVIVKQAAGQGAMYDTYMFPKEPCGATGGISVIDAGCMPIVLTPNEYRDGAVRSMS